MTTATRIEFRHPGEANGRLSIFNGSIRIFTLGGDVNLSIRGPAGGEKAIAALPKDKALEVARAILATCHQSDVDNFIKEWLKGEGCG